jgi:signal peptidase I
MKTMIWDFSGLLLAATLVCGAIWLIDAKFFKARRLKKNANAKEPMWVDYARSFFPILLFVFVLRSFVIEPYRIPSGSMEPTLLIGDFILVNKFTYGIRFPVIDKKLIAISEPERGDVMVFRFPPEPKINFIKRVIGLPGDHVVYKNKQLFINGKLITKEFPRIEIQAAPDGGQYRVRRFTEILPAATHDIYENFVTGKDADVVVPEGHYFVLGDNRDGSDDSRFWGLVPEKNIVGKAVALWMSWDNVEYNVRFSRIGTLIH